MVAFSYCGILLHFSMVEIDCIFLLWKLLHVRIVGIGFIQFYLPIVGSESLFLLRELVEFNFIFHTVGIGNLLHSNPFSNSGNWFLPFENRLCRWIEPACQDCRYILIALYYKFHHVKYVISHPY